jgi:hypothetical protein
MISGFGDAIQPSRMPAKLNALDMEPVEITFSYPNSRIDGGIPSFWLREWKRGRYTSSE